MRLVRGKNMCGLANDAVYPSNATAVGPIPPPSPPTPAPPLTHYSNPAVGLGCLSDEDSESVEGVDGAWCSPRCSFAADGVTLLQDCPQDLPTSTGPGVSPLCELPGTSTRHCLMNCDIHAKVDPCPKGASCKAVSSIAICTYDGNSTATATAP